MRFVLAAILFSISNLLLLQAAEIKQINVRPESERSFVEDVLVFKAGQEWQDSYKRISLKFLEATGRYEDIKMDWNSDSGEVSVSVEPKEYFTGLEWVDDKAPHSDEIERLCFIERESKRLSQSRINKITRCILEQVRQSGFLDAQVYLEPKNEELLIHLSQGKVYKISEIDFVGNKSFGPTILGGQIENKVGSAFQPFQVADDTERLRKFYLKRGFYLTKVSAADVEVRPATRSVRLLWKIEESNKTEFIFEGDEVSRQFIRSLEDSSEIPPDWFVDELVSEIRESFERQGCLGVQITKETRRPRPNLDRVILDIHRGRQFLLNWPQWIGLNDPDKISKIYRKVYRLKEGRFFYEESFKDHFENDFFRKLVEAGYHDVKVRNIEFSIDQDSHRVTPIIYMNEGSVYRISKLNFDGLPDAARSLSEFDDLMDELEPGDIYNSIRIDEAQNAFANAMKNAGWLDVQIERNFENQGEKTELNFIVKPGPRYRVQKVLIRGIERTNVNVIRDEIRIDEGEFYSRAEIDDTVSQILRLGISRSVDISVIDKDVESQKVVLLVDVSEAARFRFEIGPGYGTNDGLRGVFRGTYANMAGTGRRLSLYAKASRKLDTASTPDASNYKDGDVQSVPFIERRITLEYFEPSFLGTGIDGRIAIAHRKEERRDFSVLSNSAAFVLDARLDRHWTLSPEYRIEYSNPFNVALAAETQTIDDAEPSRFNSVGAQLFGSYLDDLFSPQRGLRTSLRFDLFDERLGGNLNFWIATAKQDFFLPVLRFKKSKSLGFALSLNAGLSGSYQDTAEVPVEKRFRVGGEGSVRGYPEDSIQPLDARGEPLRNGGGSTFFFRSELNIPIYGGFDLLGFFDGGNIYKTNFDFNPADLRYGAGAGIRFNTPVGPLKFGYAFILGRKPGEQVGQIYFGVGPI